MAYQLSDPVNSRISVDTASMSSTRFTARLARVMARRQPTSTPASAPISRQWYQAKPSGSALLAEVGHRAG